MERVTYHYAALDVLKPAVICFGKCRFERERCLILGLFSNDVSTAVLTWWRWNIYSILLSHPKIKNLIHKDDHDWWICKVLEWGGHYLFQSALLPFAMGYWGNPRIPQLREPVMRARFAEYMINPSLQLCRYTKLLGESSGENISALLSIIITLYVYGHALSSLFLSYIKPSHYFVLT